MPGVQLSQTDVNYLTQSDKSFFIEACPQISYYALDETVTKTDVIFGTQVRKAWKAAQLIRADVKYTQHDEKADKFGLSRLDWDVSVKLCKLLCTEVGLAPKVGDKLYWGSTWYVVDDWKETDYLGESNVSLHFELGCKKYRERTRLPEPDDTDIVNP
jgi:hypothetical protein